MQLQVKGVGTQYNGMIDCTSMLDQSLTAQASDRSSRPKGARGEGAGLIL